MCACVRADWEASDCGPHAWCVPALQEHDVSPTAPSGDFVLREVCFWVPEACTCPPVLTLEGQPAPQAAHRPRFLESP